MAQQIVFQNQIIHKDICVYLYYLVVIKTTFSARTFEGIMKFLKRNIFLVVLIKLTSDKLLFGKTGFLYLTN